MSAQARKDLMEIDAMEKSLKSISSKAGGGLLGKNRLENDSD